MSDDVSASASEKWPSDDLRRAFVEGAAWYASRYMGDNPMLQNERRLASTEAEKRYPRGHSSEAWWSCWMDPRW